MPCEGASTKPVVAELNGSPTDNNATLFKKGYDSVINAKFSSGEWTEVPNSPCLTGTTRRR